MPKYLVGVTVEAGNSYEIEAESKEQAREIVENKLNLQAIADWEIDIDIDIVKTFED